MRQIACLVLLWTCVTAVPNVSESGVGNFSLYNWKLMIIVRLNCQFLLTEWSRLPCPVYPGICDFCTLYQARRPTCRTIGLDAGQNLEFLAPFWTKITLWVLSIGKSGFRFQISDFPIKSEIQKRISKSRNPFPRCISINWNPSWKRISVRRNPFLDFAFYIWKSELEQLINQSELYWIKWNGRRARPGKLERANYC